MKIHYEPHPVSPERKAELRAQGLKIIDARFAPDGESAADSSDDALTQARAEYQEKVGKKAYHGWDADALKAKIAEAD